MKTQPIKNIFNKEDLITLCLELFHLISIAFKLKEPDIEFARHFINVMKKHYGYITFEQMEEAFERHSIGSLNSFLPKSGYSIDSKVSFSISDMTKIIRAFLNYSTPKNAEKVKERKPQKEIDEIHKQWIDKLNGIYEKYMNLERTRISIPIYYCDYLANCGLLDRKLINRKESNIIIGKNRKVSTNENLIYKCFDELLEKGLMLNDLIK